MYSKQGFIMKLREAEFNIKQLGIDHFGEKVFLKNGVHPLSILYVVNKSNKENHENRN